jgi:cofilin
MAGPSAGIPTDPKCVEKFNLMKLKKEDIKFLVFAMNSTFTKVELETIGDSSKSYDDFVKSLPSNDCRYAVVNIDFELEDGGKREKLLFVNWAPNGAKLKPKTVYASTKDDFKKQLVGVAIEMQANGSDDITFEEALAKCKQFTK